MFPVHMHIRKIALFFFQICLFSAAVFACTCECKPTKIKVKGFQGQVVAQTGPQTYEPIPKAVIELLEKTKEGLLIVGKVTTDNDGRFEFFGVKPGKYHFRAGASGFFETTSELTVKKGKSRKKEVEIGLEVARNCCEGWATVRKRA